MATTRAVIYVRQSKDVEGTRAAVDRQLEDCEKLCERNGWTVVRTYTDNDVSATKRKRRPGYDGLFTDIRHGYCDVVVAWAQDRLLRDVRDGEDLIDLVEQHGVRIATVQGGEHDLSTSDGRLHVRLLAVIAKGEMEKKSARQKREALQAAERGLPPSRGLFGYRRVDGELVQHEAEATVVRKAFDMLLKEGASTRSITKMMASSGTVTIRGREWTYRGVDVMLRNPRYAGVRCYYGKPMATGTWEPIISEDEHQAAMEILSDPSRKTNHVGSARKWLGSGLFRCHCGTIVRCTYRERVRVYQCRAATHLARKADPVDDFVTDLIAARLAMPDVVLPQKETEEMGGLRAEAQTLQTRLDVARDRLDRGVLDEDEYVATKRTIKQELSVVQRKMTTAARSSVTAQLLNADDRVEAFLEADLDGKRRIIDALVTVTLLPGKPGRRPFDSNSVQIEWR